jgi:hypothetical protein
MLLTFGTATVRPLKFMFLSVSGVSCSNGRKCIAVQDSNERLVAFNRDKVQYS